MPSTPLRSRHRPRRGQPQLHRPQRSLQVRRRRVTIVDGSRLREPSMGHPRAARPCASPESDAGAPRGSYDLHTARPSRRPYADDPDDPQRYGCRTPRTIPTPPRRQTSFRPTAAGPALGKEVLFLGLACSSWCRRGRSSEAQTSQGSAAIVGLLIHNFPQSSSIWNLLAALDTVPG